MCKLKSLAWLSHRKSFNSFLLGKEFPPLAFFCIYVFLIWILYTHTQSPLHYFSSIAYSCFPCVCISFAPLSVPRGWACARCTWLVLEFAVTTFPFLWNLFVLELLSISFCLLAFLWICHWVLSPNSLLVCFSTPVNHLVWSFFLERSLGSLPCAHAIGD